MTTVDILPVPLERENTMNIPSYSYHYPSFQRVQLAAVKDTLFHPHLPSFRRMDMDTASNKLPDEHCRTSTTCGPEDFKRATSTLFEPSKRRMSSLTITETGKNLRKMYTTPEELMRSRTEWCDFLNRSKESINLKTPDLPRPRDQHFVGYAVRYLRPEVTKSGRYTLTQEPALDQYRQRPLPANIFARFRDTYPQYSRNIAIDAWR